MSKSNDPIARLKASAKSHDIHGPLDPDPIIDADEATIRNIWEEAVPVDLDEVPPQLATKAVKFEDDVEADVDNRVADPTPTTKLIIPPTLVGPDGRQLSATVNSLGQPRKMSPEQAHAKLVGLRVYTRSYWDAQKHRIKISNRVFSGVTDPETVKTIRDSAKHTEDLLSKAMIKNFKNEFPEIYAWTEDTPGLGPVLMGRLLGEIGHPLWAFPSHWEGKGETRTLVSDPPFMRNPAKLFAYCGVGDPKRRPFKGMTDKDVYAMGNPKAKMLVHLLAESCMKQQGTGNRRRSQYRDTYDAFRARYENRVEIKEDKDGNKVEKPWSDGHKHNAALRVTGKEILLDLWIKAEQTM